MATTQRETVAVSLRMNDRFIRRIERYRRKFARETQAQPTRSDIMRILIADALNRADQRTGKV